MAGKLGYYSHESLNFPIVGSDANTLALPECDLFSSIPNQNTIESSSYDVLHPEDGNLLITSPELRFVSKASLKFCDLADRYILFTQYLWIEEGGWRERDDILKKFLISYKLTVIYAWIYKWSRTGQPLLWWTRTRQW